MIYGLHIEKKLKHDTNQEKGNYYMYVLYGKPVTKSQLNFLLTENRQGFQIHHINNII